MSKIMTWSKFYSHCGAIVKTVIFLKICYRNWRSKSLTIWLMLCSLMSVVDMQMHAKKWPRCEAVANMVTIFTNWLKISRWTYIVSVHICAKNGSSSSGCFFTYHLTVQEDIDGCTASLKMRLEERKGGTIQWFAASKIYYIICLEECEIFS